MNLPMPVSETAAAELLPWQQAAELQDDLLTVCNDLDRLQTLLSSACADLSQGFHGANSLLAGSAADAADGAWRQQVAQTLARAVTALQFEDMATQLIDHVEQQQLPVGGIARQRMRLDGRAQGHDFVRVDIGQHADVAAFAKELADRAAHRRHPGGATDHDDAQHVAALHARVAQHLAQCRQGAFEQRPRQRLQLLTSHIEAQVTIVQRAMQGGRLMVGERFTRAPGRHLQRTLVARADGLPT